MKTAGMKQTSSGKFYMPVILDSGEVCDIDLPQEVAYTIAKVSMPGGHDWLWDTLTSTFTAENCRSALCGICGNREETQEVEA